MNTRSNLSPILAALLFAAVSVAQPTPTVTVHGKLIDDLNGAPVDKAYLTFTTGKPPRKVTTETDAQGAFTLAGLAPGSYHVDFQKPGFLFDQAVDLEIPASPTFDLGELTLIAARSITGTLRWDDGDPVEAGFVHVFPIIAGKPEDAPQISRRTWSTDSRGVYRVPNLRPGRYAILATYIGPSAGTPSDGFPPRATSPLFYPGTPSMLSAGSVDVWRTREAANIDITLTERPSVLVEGTVTGSPLPPRAITGLSLVLPGIPIRAGHVGSVRPGEPFRLRAPEGDYLLLTTLLGVDAKTAYPLHVSSEPVRGLQVALPEPHPFSAMIDVEGDAESPTVPTGGIQILGNSANLGFFGMSAVSRPTGEAVFREFVPTETYTLTFNGVPEGAYIARVIQRDREQRSYPFTVTPINGPAKIILKTDSGKINGTVASDDGPASRAFVVLAPKDRSQRPRFRTAQLDRGGAFHLSNVVPGDYDLFAFDRNEEDNYLDEAYLRTHARRAIQVTVNPKSTASFQPSLIQVGSR